MEGSKTQQGVERLWARFNPAVTAFYSVSICLFLASTVMLWLAKQRPAFQAHLCFQRGRERAALSGESVPVKESFIPLRGRAMKHWTQAMQGYARASSYTT